jgi:hypothetical protein
MKQSLLFFFLFFKTKWNRLFARLQQAFPAMVIQISAQHEERNSTYYHFPLVAER